MSLNRLLSLSSLAVMALFMTAPANALTMAECSTKYNAAKDAGSLNGQTWNQFRKAECGTATTTEAAPAAAKPEKKSTAKAAKAAATEEPAATGLTMAECSTKYNAAKDAGSLNGLTWNQFRKAECAAGASAVAEPATAKPEKKATAKAAKAAAAATEEPATAGLTMAECSTKYNAAKDAGSLNGLTWNQFRKAECAAGAAATAEPVAAKPEKKAAKASDTATAEPAARGLTMQECSTRYKAAKDSGSLNGQTWNQFRKAICGPGAADDESVPSLDQANYDGDPETPTVTAPRGVKFPSAIAKKFASETPGKARLHTCLDQYYANKDADSLGGLRWIQKGGGYYSLCNAKLKG